MTGAEHVAQHDLVVRSLMLAATPEERSEERARPRRPRHVSPLPVPLPVLPPAHVFALPLVTEVPRVD